MPEPNDSLLPAMHTGGLTRSPAAGRPRPPGTEGPDPRLKAACREMEALFIHHMLSEMRKTVVKSGLIDGGRAEEVYTSLMDVEMAKGMAQSESLGLSSMLLEQLGRRYTAGSAPEDPSPTAGPSPLRPPLRRP